MSGDLKRAMTDLDVTDLARTLEKTAANLERHIAAEAQKRAKKLGETYAKAADERIRDNAVDLQRAQDLVRELRRQQEPLNRAADKANRIATVVRRAHCNGEDTISVQTLLDIINSSTKEPS